MGEARARGTFEERKEQAIAAGRIKKKPTPKPPRVLHPALAAVIAACLAPLFKLRRKG